jgi:tetratricopeptide (TPR) repeat protein
MNYCGRCGSANGTTARFCRQCGADLSNQIAISSPATPLNVEFSTKAVMKKQKKDNKPTPPQNPPADASSQKPEDSAPLTPSGEHDQDPKAISESLRRIRTSGPLIIEAIKQKQDRINEIISESIEGASDGKKEARSEVPPPPPPPPLLKPPAHIVQSGKRPVNPQQKRQASPPTPKTKAQLPSQTSAKPDRQAASSKPGGRAADQSGIQATGQPAAQTAAQRVVAATQSVARKTTGAFSGVTVMRSSTGSPTTSGQLPLNGPSTVLVQASGLKPQSGFGSKLRLGMIAVAVLLAAGTYFVFRDRLLTQAYVGGGERNLVSSEDQSTHFVRAGERERDQGNYDAAIEQFHRALELAPNNSDIRFLLAKSYFSTGQVDDAFREYQNLLRVAPEHLDARLQVAQIYSVRGNWNAAYKEYQHIIELDQRSSQAAAALEAIEKYQAEHPELHQDTASDLSRRVRAAQKGAPVLPAATLPRAPVVLLPERAVTATRITPPAALNDRSDERPDPRALADNHKKLGVRYLNVREYRAAINEFLQALRLTPDDKDLYYFIGSSYHGLGQYPDAYEYYRRVDSGPYLGPAQSGSKQTEKAAREAYKRRQALGFDSMKNEARQNPEGVSANRPAVNSLKE